MRLVGVEVRLQVMSDDGVNLTAVSVNPAYIPAAQWEDWAASGWRQSLEQVRAQVEGMPVPGPPEAGSLPPGEPL